MVSLPDTDKEEKWWTNIKILYSPQGKGDCSYVVVGTKFFTQSGLPSKTVSTLVYPLLELIKALPFSPE